MKWLSAVTVSSLLLSVMSGRGAARGELQDNQIESAFSAAQTAFGSYQQDVRDAYYNEYFLRQPGADMTHQLGTKADRVVNDDYGYLAYLFCAATLNLVNRGLVSPNQSQKLRTENVTRSALGQQALARCQAVRGDPPACTDSSKLYYYDGSCNNPRNPRLGQIFTCHRRLHPPAYDNGVNSPRSQSILGGNLPNERVISLAALNEILPTVYNDRRFNHNRMSFGQFLAHDISLTPTTSIGSTNALPDCCNANNRLSQCYPIKLAASDPVYGNRRCMNFVRSEPCMQCALGPREQMNGVTSFIDLSHTYGVTTEAALGLRSRRGGRLDGQVLTQWKSWGNPRKPYPLLLPPSTKSNDSCSFGDLSCFRGGDPLRVNQQIGISAWSTIWFRYHNFLADRIAYMNPSWSDERIFQVARRISQAHMQLVVFREWLPTIIGNNLMVNHKLRILGQTEYDPLRNPTLMSEFAGAAFRFGHSLIQNVFENRRSSTFTRNRDYDVPMKDAFSSVYRYNVFNTSFIAENFIAGMFRQPGKTISFSFAPGVAHDTYRPKNATFGMDLAALNIRRGRDHGIQPYYVYAEEYIGKATGYPIRIRTWDDIRPYWQTNCYKTLPKVYRDIRDVDLYVGGLCEVPIESGSTGVTFGSIIALQMKNIMYGDRLFVTHKGAFSKKQFQELFATAGLANIVCLSSENQAYAYTDAFRYDRNETVDCRNAPLINTKLFEDLTI